MGKSRRRSYASVPGKEHAVCGFIDVDSFPCEDGSRFGGGICFSGNDMMSSAIRRACRSTDRFKIFSKNCRGWATAKCLPYWSISRIMRPDGEAPVARSHEVTMIIRNPQIVNRIFLARVPNALQRHPLTIMARQQIAGTQLRYQLPTLTLHPEGVLRRRRYLVATHTHTHDPRCADKYLLDNLRLQLPIRIQL